MGSPEEVIAPLEYLRNKIKDLDLVAIVSQPARKVGRGKKLTDPPVAQFGKDNGITTFQPEKASSEDFLNDLRSLEPDLIITAAYGQILSDEFLKIPKRGTINIHPSKLPIYRGATPVQAALLNGDQSTAVSILFTVKKMDAGNIIIQKDFDIASDETSLELLPRLFKESGPLLEDAVKKIQDPEFEGEIQDELKVIECRKIKKEHGFINFLEDSNIIINKYRGLNPWPGVYGFIDATRVAFDNLVNLESSELNAGEYRYDKPSKMVVVGTNTNDIGIKNLKPAGKKLLDAPSFWNGLKDKTNLRFDSNAPE